MHLLCPPAALYQIQTEKSSRGNQAEIRKEYEMKTFLDWQKAAEGGGGAEKKRSKEKREQDKGRQCICKGEQGRN